jgi:hypothetical protein
MPKSMSQRSTQLGILPSKRYLRRKTLQVLTKILILFSPKRKRRAKGNPQPRRKILLPKRVAQFQTRRKSQQNQKLKRLMLNRSKRRSSPPLKRALHLTLAHRHQNNPNKKSQKQRIQ